jgi:hypothetical protein
MSDRSLRENRELTDRERAEAYKRSFYQSHLPDLPAIKGHHVCWLTTTNPRDSIAARMRLGYEPIKASEIPGFEHISMKSGEWIGCIGINEMLAFKLPLHLYETYMGISHHYQPLEEEGSIVSEAMKQQEQSEGVIGQLNMEEGTAALGKGPAPPVFADEFNES